MTKKFGHMVVTFVHMGKIMIAAAYFFIFENFDVEVF